MLIVLPPSETKASGGSGAPLDLGALSFPGLTYARTTLIGRLVRLSARPRSAVRALGLGPTRTDAIERNAALRESATMPAIERYTGVLYDALEIGSLTEEERARASERLAVGSALFGLLRADDPIPIYRLSAGSSLPRMGTLTAYWRPTLGKLVAGLAAEGAVIDLRSGAYMQLAPIPGALSVRVLSERPDGSRSVVSHFNKATKGRIARHLVQQPVAPSAPEQVVDALRQIGWTIERPRPLAIDVIVPAAAIPGARVSHTHAQFS